MEGVGGGLAVNLLAADGEELWVERPTWGTREVGVDFTTIVLDKGNGHVRRACARNEALQSIKDYGAVMHRHWPLKLVHLRVNNEQHAARIAKALANLGPADALQDDPWQFDAFRANV